MSGKEFVIPVLPGPLLIIQEVFIISIFFDICLHSGVFVWQSLVMFMQLRRTKKLVALFTLFIVLAIKFFGIPLTAAMVPFDIGISIESLKSGIIAYYSTFIFLLTTPLLMSVTISLVSGIWKTRASVSLQSAHDLYIKRQEEGVLPHIVVLLTITDEKASIITNSVDSIINSTYSSEMMTIYVTFSVTEVTSQYSDFMKYYRAGISDVELAEEATRLNAVPFSVKRADGKKIECVVGRVASGGSFRDAQAMAVAEIKLAYADMEQKCMVLLVDPKLVLNSDAVVRLLIALDSNKSRAGVSGLVYGLHGSKSTIIRHVWENEQNTTDVVLRSLEQCFPISVSPSALMLVRLREMGLGAKVYFSNKAENKAEAHPWIFEDKRYLLHLIGRHAKTSAFAFCPDAIATLQWKETIGSFFNIQKQRTLEWISDETHALTYHRQLSQVALRILYKSFETAHVTVSYITYAIILQVAGGAQWKYSDAIFITFPIIWFWYLLSLHSIVVKRYTTVWMFPFLVLITPWLRLVHNLNLLIHMPYSGNAASNIFLESIAIEKARANLRIRSSKDQNRETVINVTPTDKLKQEDLQTLPVKRTGSNINLSEMALNINEGDLANVPFDVVNEAEPRNSGSGMRKSNSMILKASSSSKPGNTRFSMLSGSKKPSNSNPSPRNSYHNLNKL